MMLPRATVRGDGLVRDHAVVPLWPAGKKVDPADDRGASRGRDDLAETTSTQAVEELARRRFELPAFGTLLKTPRTARASRCKPRVFYNRYGPQPPCGSIRQRRFAAAVPRRSPRSAWTR